MKKYIYFLLYVAITCCFWACTEKENQPDIDTYGSVSCDVYGFGSSGSQGFKVTLSDPNGVQSPQVAITESNGIVYFSEVTAGKYTIDVQREGFVSQSKSIDVVNNQTTYVSFQMSPSSYNNDELTITDIAGNPIGDQIVIPKYTSTIAIKLYNGTTKDISWGLQQICSISGKRDTTVGGYTGFTYHTFYVFSDITPTNGTLSPGDITVITGIINPDIYTLDHYERALTTMRINSSTNIHSYSKTIELYFPFMYE